MKFAGMIFFVVLIAIMSLWAVWFLAFGQATCRDVNIWAASTLLGLYTLVVVVIVNAFDWVNDWVASRAAVSGGENLGELQKQFRTLLAANQVLTQQLRATKVAGGFEPEGGLAYDPEMFNLPIAGGLGGE